MSPKAFCITCVIGGIFWLLFWLLAAAVVAKTPETPQQRGGQALTPATHGISTAVISRNGASGVVNCDTGFCRVAWTYPRVVTG